MLNRPHTHVVAVASNGRLEAVALLIESLTRLELHNFCSRGQVPGAGSALLNACFDTYRQIGKPCFWDTVSAAEFYKKPQFDFVCEVNAQSFRLREAPENLGHVGNLIYYSESYLEVQIDGEIGRVYFTADSSPAVRIWVESVAGNPAAVQMALALFGTHYLVAEALRSGRRVYYPAPAVALPEVWEVETVTLFTFAP